MNILENIPSLSRDEIAEQGKELTLEDIEQIEADDKAERVKFHHNQVRNGPVNFVSQSAGQVRRASSRALKGRTKRARRKQVGTYFDQVREVATLRGNLQAVGVIAYVNPSRKLDPVAAHNATVWLLNNYAPAGDLLVTNESVTSVFEVALNRYQSLTGQETTPLSPAYVLPVRLSV